MFLFGAAPPLAALPQVSLFAPENQRLQDDFDWFGLLVEFNLRAQFVAAGLTPASFEVTALARPQESLSDFSITGAFQKVGRLIYLQLSLNRAGVERLRLEETFTKTEVADKLDQMGRKLVRAAGGVPKDTVPYLAHEVGQALFEARLKRLRGQGLSIDQARQLDQTYGSAQAEPEVLAEVVAHLLLAAQQDIQRGAPLLKRADRLLRRALQKQANQGHLLALLALGYHLGQSYPSFVEQTAAKALKLAPNDELAALMLALSAGPTSGAGQEAIKRFRRLNPWAFKGTGKRAYWLGILSNDLERVRQAAPQDNL